MSYYDLYGINVSSIQEAKEIVEGIGVNFTEHESSYHHGPYFRYGEIGQENFEIKANVDPDGDFPNEPEFPDSLILLYVNNTERHDELKSMLLESDLRVSLLRHERL